ncbi:hypothetical protein GFS60_02317 [Rhodococcus sp. WAY2]|nr:hypothetical protein GFS60_02317 [Rhodococcus sp. WAY2]
MPPVIGPAVFRGPRHEMGYPRPDVVIAARAPVGFGGT